MIDLFLLIRENLLGGGGGGRNLDVMFSFLCQKLQCVNLSEIVLESFPDNDNFDYFYKEIAQWQ